MSGTATATEAAKVPGEPQRFEAEQPAVTASKRSFEPAQLLRELLTHCVEIGASDLHVSSGQEPFYRNDGVLRRTGGWPVLSAEDVQLIAEALAEGRDLSGWKSGAIDGATTEAGGRFRYNIFRRQNAVAIAIRRLEERIRTLSELGLPDSLYELADLKDGLVIVAGPTGSGKSTTLATLIDRVNREHQSHIITIEDPIEYVHPPRKSLVNQRQVGVDSESFDASLVASLRQDPDVILVGEIRELSTIRTAITAAETGHLVFTTVHAGDCVGVIERITSVFPADEQPGVRRQLALVLKAVIAQQLLVADGSAVNADEKAGSRRVARRVLASEVMRVTSAVGNLIATGKSAQIMSSIESGAAQGMKTLDQDLARLIHKGMISERTAAAYAQNPTIVQDRLARLRRGGSSGEGRR